VRGVSRTKILEVRLVRGCAATGKRRTQATAVKSPASRKVKEEEPRGCVSNLGVFLEGVQVSDETGFVGLLGMLKKIC